MASKSALVASTEVVLPTLAEGAKAVAAAMVERRTVVFMMISFESSDATFIQLATVKIGTQVESKDTEFVCKMVRECTYVACLIPADSFDLEQKSAFAVLVPVPPKTKKDGSSSQSTYRTGRC